VPASAEVRFTDRTDGDLAVRSGEPGLGERRQAVSARPWTWLHQVHGSRVVVVGEPGQHAGVEADAAVTACPGAALAVQAADCAPLALVAPGAVGVVHVGWRGLADGVVDAAVGALRELDDGPIVARLGPCIRPRCYEFGADDLAAVAASCGEAVRATTAWGTPALDVPAGIAARLDALGVAEVDDVGTCTACSPRHWSHRARADQARQAVVAWLAT
jgi:purine-nucleoside/S-methyl-5'-thioadenosine phosphorylase / adenosine deaminase